MFCAMAAFARCSKLHVSVTFINTVAFVLYLQLVAACTKHVLDNDKTSMRKLTTGASSLFGQNSFLSKVLAHIQIVSATGIERCLEII